MRRAPEHDADADGRPEKACLVTPSGVLTIPGPEEPVTATLKLTSEERERYLDDVFNAVTPDEGKHQLLGWGTATSPDAQKKGFELLLQIDSDDKLGLEIGDVETLRVHIDSRKLATKDFSSVRANCAEE